MATPRRAETSLPLAIASFANMFSVGTVYALSILQVELPRLLGVSQSWSYAPFGAACLGLCVGVSSTASLLHFFSSAGIVAASGTITWGLAVVACGHFLSNLSFPGILSALAMGGIGVGWTYLAVVVLVGQAFPGPTAGQARARSAIGPLGFSSGAATCIVLSSRLGFAEATADKLGTFLQLGGGAFVALGLGSLLLVSGHWDSAGKHAVSSKPVLKLQPANTSIRNLFSALLFLNALPGMVAFSALLPAATFFTQGDDQGPRLPLTFAMMALASGGIFALPLHSRLGTHSLFAGLLSLRGFLLVILYSRPDPKLALITLLALLFAHGVGFSVIPGLIKARLTDQEEFPWMYGQVLVAWGVAGVAASVLNGAFVP
jgi:hypothetical protein